MISIIGIGNAASAVAEKFSSVSQYNVYLLNSKVEQNTAREYKLNAYENPEEYEQNIPDLTSFFADIDDRVQVFVTGASLSSIYSLAILEQVKNKNIDVFYIKPDIELLTGIPRLVENAVFGILQEYARSGKLKTFTIFSNENIERVHTSINIKTYYETLNDTIFSAVHYLNYFEHTEPHIGNMSKPNDISRIRTIGMLDMKKLNEMWLFDLDMERELCYYMCINDERLENEVGLHKKLVDILKSKPRNAFRKISYSIYETQLQDFGFVVAHTNATQSNKNTLDKIDQG
ncbi:MAG: hypothetical protein CMC82_04625 [Flavobacteriaceae bacterium]|nr:hypothetical protein [Flavobacteriaceae bacterium]|tara:strand:+ start:1706 stop:2572 length:867 start_codon:yes stop_codon:yes gene_type:complete